MMIDSHGSLVWTDDKFGVVTDVKVQRYRDQNYLTFWSGIQSKPTFGEGHYVMLDEYYEVYRTISAAGGMQGDLHKFQITSDGTALITVYSPAPADLSCFLIDGQGWIWNSIFQEIDIETGNLFFEWRASDQFSLGDCYASPQKLGVECTSPETAFDYFHINSVSKDELGNYYISGRHTRTIVCITSNGEISWILGRKRNEFKDLSPGTATNFAYHHQVTLLENGLMTLFDNGRADHWDAPSGHSRGVLLALNFEEMTVKLLQEYTHPSKYASVSQSSMQAIARTGNMLIGWGSIPAYTEYNANGDVLCDAHSAPSLLANLGWVTSYRAFRVSSWIGRPKTRPSVHFSPLEAVLYVSWNGATEVDQWLLQGADEPLQNESKFADIMLIPTDGFETSITLEDDMPHYLQVAALDRREGIRAPFWTRVILFGTAFIAIAILIWRMRRQHRICTAYVDCCGQPDACLERGGGTKLTRVSPCLKTIC